MSIETRNTRGMWRRGWLRLVAICALLAVAIGCLVDHCARPSEADAVGPADQYPAIEAASLRGRVLRVEWAGTDLSDSTDLLQGAIDSGADTVVVPYRHEPWIVRPIRLRTCLQLTLEPGVVLLAKKGEFQSVQDSLLYADDMCCIKISAYGATLRMHKSDYQATPYAPSEWRHGVRLLGAADVEISGLRVENTGGDGIYVGPTNDKHRIPCRRIYIEDCTLAGNHRQGISITSAVGVRVKNCLFTGTKGTAPQAGLDVEPGSPYDLIQDIQVENCTADSNVGSGFLVILDRLSRKSEDVSVRFSRCHVRRSVQPGLRAVLPRDQGARGLVEFVDCTVETTQLPGATVIWDMRSKVDLRFKNCTWSNVGQRAGHAPLYLELVGGEPGESECAVCFENARLFDHRGRDPLVLNCQDGASFPNVCGSIECFGGRVDVMGLPQLPSLRVHHGTLQPAASGEAP